jgi:hypothetical protein
MKSSQVNEMHEKTLFEPLLAENSQKHTGTELVASARENVSANYKNYVIH